MTRIIHFSDIHFGRPALSPGAWFDKRLLGTLNYLARRRGKLDEGCLGHFLSRCRELAPDLLVCTGDITCVGTPKEFSVAEEQLAPFLELPGTRFCYVPGNHDAYVGSKPCRAALLRACRRLNPGLNWREDTVFLPFPALPGYEIALLRQAFPTNIFLSSGTVSRQAAAALLAWTGPRQTATASPRILIGHFPLRQTDGSQLAWRRRLRHANSIAHLVDNGAVNLYLCGHIHTPFVRQPSPFHLECCAGSLTMNHTFAIIDLEADGSINHRWETI